MEIQAGMNKYRKRTTEHVHEIPKKKKETKQSITTFIPR